MRLPALIIAAVLVASSMLAGTSASAAGGLAFDAGGVPAHIVISSHGDLLYVALPDERRIDAFSTTTSARIASYAVDGAPTRLALAPDGSRIYAIGRPDDGSIHVIRTTDGAETVWPLGLLYARDLAILPNGQELAVAHAGSFTVVSTATGARTTSRSVDSYDVLGVQFLDARSVVVDTGSVYSGVGSGYVRVYDLSQPFPLWSTFSWSFGGRVAANPDGTRFYVPSVDGPVWAIDRHSTDRVSWDKNTWGGVPGSRGTEIAISRDGLRAFTIAQAADGTGVLQEFRTVGDHLDREWALEETPRALALTPDNRAAWYSSANSRVIRRVDVTRLTPLVPDVSRVFGKDRFETAVAVSRRTFTAGAPIAFLASGLNFPDALSAAPAAILRGGPVLLTAPDALPASVRSELIRLNPSTVVVMGGLGAVEARVRQEIRSLLPAATLTEITGATRYDVSRNLLSVFYPDSTPVFVANGEDFPDALSAAPVAARSDQPVLLVPNLRSADAPLTALEPATRALLSRDNHVRTATIVGGPGAISADVAYAISYSTPLTASRIWGQDRYRGSQRVNAAFTSSDVVYLASGLDYPDALAGAVAAGSDHAPLYIVPPNCVPRAVLDEIDRLKATKVVVLGGTGALGSAVSSLTPC